MPPAKNAEIIDRKTIMKAVLVSDIFFTECFFMFLKVDYFNLFVSKYIRIEPAVETFSELPDPSLFMKIKSLM